ncbi:hypothetical protein BH24ACT3_BH24ACT3_11500 [soil metagenome]
MHEKALTAGSDAAALTAPARNAFLRRFEVDVEPDRILAPEERARRAEEALRRHFAALGRKSGKSRRDRSEQVADLLKRARTNSGMALVIDDPAIIAKVAGIVAAGGGADAA